MWRTPTVPLNTDLPSVRPTDLAGGPPGLKMSFVTPRTSIGLVAAGHEAAVDVENRAGDPAGLIGEQIGDGVGDVGGGADSSQWMKRRESVKRGVDLVFRDPPLESGGLDGGRCHRVDADLVPGKLDGQVMGERMQPGFLHRVPRRRGQTDRLMCPHAADVDDGAALPAGDHALNDGLRQEEQGIVELHVRVVDLRVVLEERLGDEESGRIDQQCRIAVLLRNGALHIGDRGAIRQIGGDAPGLATLACQLSDGVVDTVFRQTDDHRAPAMIDDVDCDLPTDAGTAADNNDLLGPKMHIRGAFLVLLAAPTGPRYFVSTTRRIQGCRRIRAWTCGWAG